MSKQNKKAKGRPLGFSEEVVIEQAVRAFWERGYDGVSMDYLCNLSKLSKTSFYNSFGDKEELFIKCLEFYEKKFSDPLLELLLKERNPSVGFYKMLVSAVRRTKDPEFPTGCLIITGALEAKGKGSKIDKKLKALQNALYLNLKKYFTFKSSSEDADYLSSFVIAQLFAVMMFSKTEFEAVDVDKHIEGAQKTFEAVQSSKV